MVGRQVGTGKEHKDTMVMGRQGQKQEGKVAEGWENLVDVKCHAHHHRKCKQEAQASWGVCLLFSRKVSCFEGSEILHCPTVALFHP